MKPIKNNILYTSVVTVFSLFYAITFIICSNSVEFISLLNHATTLNSDFWNSWSNFLKQGNLQYIGYVYIVLVVMIVILSILKNYKTNNQPFNLKGLSVSGAITMFLVPICFLLVLSDPNYSIETATLFVVLHWSVVLIVDVASLFFLSRRTKEENQ